MLAYAVRNAQGIESKPNNGRTTIAANNPVQ